MASPAYSAPSAIITPASVARSCSMNGTSRALAASSCAVSNPMNASSYPSSTGPRATSHTITPASIMLNPSACAAPPPAFAGGPATAALIRRTRLGPAALSASASTYTPSLVSSCSSASGGLRTTGPGASDPTCTPAAPSRSSAGCARVAWIHTGDSTPAAGRASPTTSITFPPPGTRANASAAPSSTRGGRCLSSGW